jgi:hypothetical protein
MLAEPRYFEGMHCTIEVRRPAVGVVVVTFLGTDTGELGEAPFLELDSDLEQQPTIALFIDARQARAASVDVSGRWASWMRQNHARLTCVHMLTATRFIELSAQLVKRFANLGDRMTVYTSQADFDAALAAATR